MTLHKSAVVVSVLAITGCDIFHHESESSGSGNKNDSATRWYNEAMIAKGEPLFQKHCSGCHQPDASGTKNWREPLPDGRYPPPPLNGTAHTWHHPLPVLKRTIKRGGVPLGGYMPGFVTALSESEIESILAWIQSHWPNETYRIWSERNNASLDR